MSQETTFPQPSPPEPPPMVARLREALMEFKEKPDSTAARGGVADALHEMCRYLSPKDMSDVVAFAGRKLMPDTIAVDLNANTASRNGVVLKLSPSRAALLYCFATAYPNAVTKHELRKAVWGRLEADDPRRDMNTLRVLISHLRAPLAVLGGHIVNTYNKGYRLELGPMESGQ